VVAKSFAEVVSTRWGIYNIPNQLGFGCGNSLGPNPCAANDLGAAWFCKVLPGTNGAAFTAANDSFVLLLFAPPDAARTNTYIVGLIQEYPRIIDMLPWAWLWAMSFLEVFAKAWALIGIEPSCSQVEVRDRPWAHTGAGGICEAVRIRSSDIASWW